MEEINKEQLIEKMIYSINDFKDEMLKSLNYIREDVKVIKGENKELRQELKDYNEECNRRLEENEERWEKFEEGRRNGRKFLLDKMKEYNVSVSE